jgi:hypothetical protein
MSRMKTCRILHREYFIKLERNAYSWRIVAITHRLGNSFLPTPAFFYPNQAAAAECARAAVDRHLNGGCMDWRPSIRVRSRVDGWSGPCSLDAKLGRGKCCG